MKTYKISSCVLLLLFSGFILAGPGPSKPVREEPPKAQDDFYMYVNGPWVDTHSTFGTAEKQFCNAHTETFKHLNNLKDKCVEDLVADGQVNKIKTVYDILKQDNDEIRQSKIVLMGKYMTMIDQIKDEKSILQMAGFLDKFDARLILKIEMLPYPDTSGRAVPYIYLSQKSELPNNINRIKGIFLLMDIRIDSQTAENILKLNNTLNCEHIMCYQPSADYTMFEGSTKKLPEAWKAYLDAADVNTNYVKINSKSFKLVNELLATITPEEWKWYFKFRFLYAYRWVLSNPAKTPAFTMHDLAIAQITSIFGDELNRLCFHKYITENQDKINEIFQNLKIAYLNGLDSNVNVPAWIKRPATRQQIESKIKNMRIAIGYPDYHSGNDGGYQAIGSVDVVVPDDPLGSVLRINEQRYKYTINKLNKPLQYVSWPDAWTIAYSAGNILSQNAILIPMIYLLPPYFYSNKDSSFNYGSLGYTFGHEMSHAFDKGLGLDYNEFGNKVGSLVTQDELDILGDIELQVYSQYSKYKTGTSTPENIADIRGLKMAYDAYIISLRKQSIPIIGNSKGDELFYYAFAKLWQDADCNNNIDYSTGNVSAHSSPLTRVNNTLRNQDGFYKAYGVKPGDKMYLPEDKRIGTW
jgi:predicted metalloendopeptidase